MVVREFHLLGDGESHMLEIDAFHNLENLKYVVADAFSIVEPEGVGFQTAQSQDLATLDEVLDFEGSIAVTVDGHAVRDIPAPQGLPVLGSYLQVYPDHLGNHQPMFERLGPVIKHTDMGRTTYLTNDPRVSFVAFQESAFWSKKINEDHPLWAIKDPDAGVFLSNTDTDAWRYVHRFLPPALSPKAVRHYTPMMQATAQSTFKVFDELDGKGEAFNTFQYMFKLASQAVGKLALGENFDHFSSPDAPLHKIVRSVGEVLELNKKVQSRGEWYSHLPFGDPHALKTAKLEFQEECETAIKRAQAKNQGDLPIAEAALIADSIADYAARAIDENGKKLPRQNLIPAMSVVLGAGFTTTASLMSWMIYSMVTYPGVQDKLVQELIDHDVDSHTEWTFDSTNSLPYLDKFIKETQRLHNPSYQPGRTALRDQIVPGGYRFPKDGVIICALHHLHNNTAYWKDPAKFDPDRWDTEEVKNRPKGLYAPFAQGPRSCIGFNFALQEVKTVMPTLIYRYEFSRVGDDPIEYDPFFALIRPMNLYVRAKKRETWPAKTNNVAQQRA